MNFSSTALWQLKTNQQARISGIAPNVDPGLASRLRQMGFNSGCVVKCLRRTPLQGPMVIQLGDSVYSLEKSVASNLNISLPY